MTHNRTIRHQVLTAASALFILGLLPHSPVSAQSVLTLQPGAESGKDAWIWSFENARDVNFGVRTDVNGGLNNVIRAEVWEWTDRADTIRALLAFDLSEIPAGASITNARLSLSFFANPQFTPQTGDNNLAIRRITSEWDEALVTWNNQPTTTEEKQVVLPPSNSTSQDYPDIDVTELVRAMVENPGKNFGFMLAMQKEVVFKGLTFASSDHTNPALHPKLEITYETVSDVQVKNEGSHSSLRLHVEESGDQLRINGPLTDMTQLEVSLSDISGNQILHGTYALQNGVLPVHLADLADGLYFVQLSGGTTSSVHKLIRVDGRTVLTRTERA